MREIRCINRAEDMLYTKHTLHFIEYGLGCQYMRFHKKASYFHQCPGLSRSAAGAAGCVPLLLRPECGEPGII